MKSSKRNKTRVLQVESLESRKLMAVDVSLSGGLLKIHGDNADNSVQVGVSSGRVQVTIQGVSKVSSFSGVKKIEFLGYGGNDRFENNTSIEAYISGGSGNDRLIGGSGVDEIVGGSGNDSLYGMAGHDKLFGMDGNDVLEGGSGNDDLYGGAGIDSLYGQSGNDYLEGDGGGDTIFGGTGDDVVWYDNGIASSSERDSIQEVESINIDVPDQATVAPQGSDNSCGPNSATRVMRAYGGIVSLNTMKNDVKENSFISSWGLGTTGNTLVEAMNRNARGLGSKRFDLVKDGSFSDILRAVQDGKPVVTMIASSYDVRKTKVLGVTVASVTTPMLHWIVINGYNSKTQTVRYTDTNGKAYEASVSEMNNKFQWSGSSGIMASLRSIGVRPGTYIV